MQPVSASYSFVLVAVSLVISAIGSFIAFHAIRSADAGGGKLAWKRISLASLALGGIGIWTMHFVGMLALRLPVPHGYALQETLVSLGIVLCTTAAAFRVMSENPREPWRLALASLLLGLGVCGMHYTGMFGMRFDGHFDWSAPVVMLSLLLSVAGSGVALWLVFATRSPKALRAAPVVMACAVSGMHYIAMSAATFICSVDAAGISLVSRGIVRSNDLPTIVITALVGLVALLTLDQWLWSSPSMQETREKKEAAPLSPQVPSIGSRETGN